MNLQVIQNKIYEIRGIQVMLDFDLAELYQVETRILNQSVKRNIKRFPPDFMFQLNEEEFSLVSQFVIPKMVEVEGDYFLTLFLNPDLPCFPEYLIVTLLLK